MCVRTCVCVAKESTKTGYRPRDSWWRYKTGHRNHHGKVSLGYPLIIRLGFTLVSRISIREDEGRNVIELVIRRTIPNKRSFHLSSDNVSGQTFRSIRNPYVLKTHPRLSTTLSSIKNGTPSIRSFYFDRVDVINRWLIHDLVHEDCHNLTSHPLPFKLHL